MPVYTSLPKKGKRSLHESRLCQPTTAYGQTARIFSDERVRESAKAVSPRAHGMRTISEYLFLRGFCTSKTQNFTYRYTHREDSFPLRQVFINNHISLDYNGKSKI